MQHMLLIIIVSINCKLAFCFSIRMIRKYLADIGSIDENNLISLFYFEPSWCKDNFSSVFTSNESFVIGIFIVPYEAYIIF